ncbi:MAG: polyamine aminopropyltransferase [Anaerolineae bacterium]|nr:polyamine aminopropyltransferase [Anaerolineae bacterium]
MASSPVEALETSTPPSPSESTSTGVTQRERATLLISVLIISICALVYELIVGTLSSYLLGDSVTQFSITIGLFLFAMGLGSLLSRRIKGNELRWFIIVELLTGLFGGSAAAILYAVYATSLDYYYLVMIGVILSIGICIGLEIPLLMRIVAKRSELAKALSDVLSIDYIGALLGSLAFPLILLPTFGVNQTGFLIGLFNIMIAAINLYVFRDRLKPLERRVLAGLSLIFVVIMIMGVSFSSLWVRFFEQGIYQDLIVYREQSTYQRLIMTRDGFDLRLYLDGNLQFSSRDEYRYHELLVHPVMGTARSRESVLILGGGDGMVAREVLKYPEVQRVLMIDLDPAMTDLARTYAPLREINADALHDPRLEVINTDAYRFIEETDEVFPVIIIDLPDPNNEALSKLYSRQFYRLLREHLSPDGAFVTQATSPYFVRSAFWTIVHTIRDAGFETLPLRTYVPSFGEWGFVIGTPHLTPNPRLIDGIAMRYLTPTLLEGARYFDPDISEVPTDINTLDDPVLPQYYEDGWRQWD